MNDVLSDKWKELSESTGAAAGLSRLRLDPDHFYIYVALQHPEKLPALIIEVATEEMPVDLEFPQSAGFQVAADQIKVGQSSRVRIVLMIKDVLYQDVFEVLAQDIYEKLVPADSETDLVRSLVAQLYRWQGFLKHRKDRRLSDSEQTGLWGELWFMNSKLLPEVGEAGSVGAWRGAERKNQDFEFSGIAVEVKTTSANPHEKVHISNLRQLEPSGLKRLYLYHLAVVIHRESGISLPDLIGSIRGALSPVPQALEAFNNKLFLTGYLDPDSDYYYDRGYSTLRDTLYEVREGFPRLVQDSLPEGVGDVKYSIVLASCSDFAVDDLRFSDREE